MKEYIVYFEIYGKKLKTTIKASSQSEAKNIVAGKLKFNKILEKTIGDPIVDHFKNIFNIK